MNYLLLNFILKRSNSEPPLGLHNGGRYRQVVVIRRWSFTQVWVFQLCLGVWSFMLTLKFWIRNNFSNRKFNWNENLNHFIHLLYFVKITCLIFLYLLYKDALWGNLSSCQSTFGLLVFQLETQLPKILKLQKPNKRGRKGLK